MQKSIFILAAALFMSLFACKQSTGEAAEVSEAAEVAETTGTTVAVDTDNSVISWEGSKPTGTHTGTIAISEGSVAIADGKVSGGSFVINMDAITVTDLEGDQKVGLENHLKGYSEGKEDHFFDVAKYPTGKFEITKITALSGDEAANSMVYGNLTLKDQTKEVGFKANIDVNGNRVVVTTPQFTINRTDWGVNYGSKSVFDNLGDKFINDEISLAINLTAGKAAM